MGKVIYRFVVVCFLAATSTNSSWAQKLGPRNGPSGQAASAKSAIFAPVTTANFEPDHFPTQQEITALGSTSGPLSPIGNANEGVMLRQLNEAVRNGRIALKAALPAARVDRLRRSNRMFALAMNDWNNNRRDEAVRTFEEFAKTYPDSPWSGEALLHVADVAKVGGRYEEARGIYQFILENTVGVPGSDSYQVNMMARQGMAEITLASGDISTAKAQLRDILTSDTHPLRHKIAVRELHELSLREGSPNALWACGTQALADILVSAGRQGASARLARLKSPRPQGWSLAELQRLALHEGISMQGFGEPTGAAPRQPIATVSVPTPEEDGANPVPGSSRIAALAKLPTPFIIQCGRASLRKAGQSMGQALGEGLATFASLPKGAAASAPPEYFEQGANHYWVVRKINAKDQTAVLFNPSDKELYPFTWAQLDREWTGRGLTLTGSLNDSGARLARLDSEAMARTFGTGWGPHFTGGLGHNPNNHSVKLGCTTPQAPHGEPTISVNAVSMNVLVEDTPLWYTPPVGPGVHVTIAYNSQETLPLSLTGIPEWCLNYDVSYELNGTLTSGYWVVHMPDGKDETYDLSGAAREPWNEKGFYVDTLLNTANLVFPNYEIWRFKLLSGSSKPVLQEIDDPRGNALKFTYASYFDIITSTNQNRLSYIEDAQLRKTNFFYDPTYRGVLASVTDPFGRSCYFNNAAYYGSAVDIVDMGGNSYSCDVDISPLVKLTTSRGIWSVYEEANDAKTFSSFTDPTAIYPVVKLVPHSPYVDYMGQNYRITVQDPNLKSEEFYFSAKHLAPTTNLRTWYVDKNQWRPYNSVTDNNGVYFDASNVMHDIVKKTSYFPTINIGNEWFVTKKRDPDRAVEYDGSTEQYDYDLATGRMNKFVSTRHVDLADGKSVQATYNSKGRVTSITDERGNTTTINYAANNWDVTTVIDALSQTVATYSLYNSIHQPGQVVDAEGHITTFAYNTWGPLSYEIEAVGEPEQRRTDYTYDTSGRLTGVSRTAGASTYTLATYTYDARDMVRTATDARGVTLTYDYTNLDQVDKVTYPDATFVDPTWCNCGLLNSVTDRSGRTTSYEYDNLKRLTKTTDPALRTVLLTYDAAGNVTDLTNEKSVKTHWTYDVMNRPAAKYYAYTGSGTPAEAWAYDLDGNVGTKTESGSILTNYTYDDTDNLTNIDRTAGGADVGFTYDALNRRGTMTDGRGTTTWTYTLRSQLKDEHGLWLGDKVSYSYDALGRRTNLGTETVNNGVLGAVENTAYTYDGLDRMTSITSPAGAFTYTYAGNSGLVAGVAYPNWASTANVWEADESGRLTSAQTLKYDGTSTANVANYASTYDSRDILTGLAVTLPSAALRNFTFTYDDDYQLTREKSLETTPVRDSTYNYDAAGNRLSVVDVPSGVTTTSTYTAGTANTYTQVALTGGTTKTDKMTSLPAGMRQVGDSVYVYDFANRLSTWTQYDRSVELPGAQGRHRMTWLYDGLNRVRIVTESHSPDGVTWTNNTGTPDFDSPETRFVYSGMDIIQERLKDSAVPTVFDVSSTNTWGLDVSQTMGGAGGVGGLLARTIRMSGGTLKKLYAHHDGRGNIIALTKEGTTLGATASVVARYEYDSYGRLISSSGVESANNLYRYQSKRLDVRSQNYDFGYRFYSPRFGRFISLDPIRESGGINLYEYVGNSPINLADGRGLTDANHDGCLDEASASACVDVDADNTPVDDDPTEHLPILRPNSNRTKPDIARVEPPSVDEGVDFITLINNLGKSVGNERRNGVNRGWADECRLFRETGEGTVEWTESEAMELLTKGRVSGYRGHHINSVKDYPWLAGRGNNIVFVKPRDHLDLHGGNWRNGTSGPLLKR